MAAFDNSTGIIASADYSKVIPIVSRFFSIKSFYQKDRLLKFLVSESPNPGENFARLQSELKEIGMIAQAKRSNFAMQLMPSLTSLRLSEKDGIVITVAKSPVQKNNGKRWVPILLFAATVTTVYIDGIFRSGSIFARGIIDNPISMAAIYTVSLLGILGIHELGHIVAARKYRLDASWPYFIPGIPGFLTPTFGALIVTRSNMPSRKALFDIGIAGPIAGLVIAIIVSMYGASISVLIPETDAQQMMENGRLMEFSSSIFMVATMYAAGVAQEGFTLIMSPILFAAWIGFYLTFLNLLPAWQLDGGHIIRSAIGRKWHRIATYASVGVLLLLQNYIMAALVLLLSRRSPEAIPLDDITPVSQKRKILFVTSLAIAALCAPLPPAVFEALNL